MQILATMPGRFGDQLWQLPAVRALHEAGHRVTLALSPKYSSLKGLIAQQAYVARVIILDGWEIREDAPISPRFPPWDALKAHPQAMGLLVNLGYDGWPQAPLPYHVYNTLKREHPDLPIAPLDLERAWIRADPWKQVPHEILVGFSDEWFELKYGLAQLLTHHTIEGVDGFILCPPDSRWEQEGKLVGVDWVESAQRIAAGRVFLGCCSALHVLACAIGTPCIIAEPAEARHSPIFWPYGKDGPRVLAPKGNDGRQTWDARAIRAAIDHFFQTGRLA